MTYCFNPLIGGACRATRTKEVRDLAREHVSIPSLAGPAARPWQTFLMRLASSWRFNPLIGGACRATRHICLHEIAEIAVSIPSLAGPAARLPTSAAAFLIFP